MCMVHHGGNQDRDRVEERRRHGHAQNSLARKNSDTSSPTVTALQATPMAERGETAKTTTTARSAGIPTKRAAVCWRLCATSNRYAIDATATAPMSAARLIRAPMPAASFAERSAP